MANRIDARVLPIRFVSITYWSNPCLLVTLIVTIHGGVFLLVAKNAHEAQGDIVRITVKRWRFDQVLAGTRMFAGVDEVGRGCLAGPVVAAAVMLPESVSMEWSKIKDSKKISAKMRACLFEIICNQAWCVGVGKSSVEEIDDLNILQASRLAMGRAIQNLTVKPTVVLVDGLYSAWMQTRDIASLPIVDGDARCISIAAASIVAKVTRDRLMAEYGRIYPQYGFERHSGYGTKEHCCALERFGPTNIHRQSFAPIQKLKQTNLGI